MFNRRVASFAWVLLLAGQAPLQTAWFPLVLVLPDSIRSYASSKDFVHQTGRSNTFGWQADFRIDAPGYAVKGLSNGGEQLAEGSYEYDFYFAIRPGSLPGLLSSADDVARIEVFDATTHEVLLDRTFQRDDFPSYHRRRLVMKALIFTTRGRADHRIEPRVYWPGLAGFFLQRIDLRPLSTLAETALAAKARAFESLMDPSFLLNGFVVLRDEKGVPQDFGDTAIWTGLYAAAESWRYRATHDPHALDRMERSLWSLHRLYQSSPTPGALVRYVDSDGAVWPVPPSKDTYTGFVFGVAQCLPVIRTPALRVALRNDVLGLADCFIDHDLSFPFSNDSTVDLNPYLPFAFFPMIMTELRRNSTDAHRLAVILQALRFYFLFQRQRPVPSFRRLIDWLQHPKERWEPSVVDLLNDGIHLIGQVEENVHRSALAAHGYSDAPYVKLDLLLLRTLRQLDSMTDHTDLRHTDQLKIRPSEALLALHIIKVAAAFSATPNRFTDYYRANLWKEKALLTTTLDWNQIDEEFNGLIFGETFASANRTDSSHLPFLALYDLVELEKDPYLRFQYKTMFEKQFAPMRSDGNAMLQAMETQIGLRPDQWGLILWSLSHYPNDRVGRGDAYWQLHRSELMETYGSVAGKVRDPLSMDLRPRDAFIWQRSARAIRGDQKDWFYPPMDFLFAYWLGRLTEGSAMPLEVRPDSSPSLRTIGAPSLPVQRAPSS